MRNPYYNLLKTIKQADKSENISKADTATAAAVEGLLSKKLLDKSLENLLGTKKFYHGTSDSAAKAIRREGLDPSKGGNPFGSSNAVNSNRYVENSKGKVHVATNTIGKLLARMHAILSQSVTKDETGSSVRPHTINLFELLAKKGPGTVLRGYMPYEKFLDNFEADPDHTPIFTHRSTTAVPSKSISGGGFLNNYKTLFKNVSSDIPGYIKSNPVRASKGLLFLLGSGFLGDKAFGNVKDFKKSLEKKATAMTGGSFLPPEPLPNSVKAKQIEQQELAEQQAQVQPDGVDPQLAQMQKAQEDAVNELQSTKQQLAQAQNDLQNVQAQSQQQQQAAQAQAQQEIQKAQLDAQYELQSEKIKNQQKLLSMQEKYLRSAGKAKPDQNHILSNQLKRVVKKVNGIKIANAPPIIDAATGKVVGSTLDNALSTAVRSAPNTGMKSMGMLAGKTLGRAAPFLGAGISGASAINNFRKGNYLSAGADVLGGVASFIPGFGIPLSLGAGFLSSALENKPKPIAPATPAYYGNEGDGQFNIGSVMSQVPGMISSWTQNPAQAQQTNALDTGANSQGRYNFTNQFFGKSASQVPATPSYPDIRKFMKNPPPPGEDIASPMPLLQNGLQEHKFNMPRTYQQGYGPIGDFIKQLIFQVGMPYLGMRNPLYPDFSRVYGGLIDNEAYKLRVPQTFN